MKHVSYQNNHYFYSNANCHFDSDDEQQSEQKERVGNFEANVLSYLSISTLFGHIGMRNILKYDKFFISADRMM